MPQFMKAIFRNELLAGIFMFLVFILLVLTSCATYESYRAPEKTKDTAAATSQNDSLNAKLLETGPRNASIDYKIGPEDLLEISVFQAEELKTLVRVSANGFIRMNLAEEVQAEGLSASELEAIIAGKLQRYLKNPMVSVFIKEYRAQPISVLGAVKDPHVYYVTGQKYLIDMISLAGGLTPEAGGTCILQTAGPNPGERVKIDIDLTGLLVEGKPELNKAVRTGDIIQIPKTGVFYVDGAVRNPGDFQIKSKTTLTQAISMAKGLDFAAIHSDVKVYRDNGTPEKEIITIDYDSVMSGKERDIELRDKDFIYVAESAIKKFIKGLTGAFYSNGYTGVNLKGF